jgi:hypothetical protein
MKDRHPRLLQELIRETRAIFPMMKNPSEIRLFKTSKLNSPDDTSDK